MFVPHVHAQLIALGGYHPCVSIDVGSTFCWGKDSLGQLGDGDSDALPWKAVPTLVPGLDKNVKALALRHDTTCAVKSDDTLWCFGANTYGNDGTGVSGSKKIPSVVYQAVGLDPVSISVGQGHVYAVAHTGALWCWGANTNDQLGLGTETNENTPQQWALGLDVPVARWNQFGQLGKGSTGGNQATPTPSSFFPDVKEIACGAYHTCMLRFDGTVWCWGRNLYGEWGVPGVGNANALYQVPGVENVASIAAGGYHTCFLWENGVMRCLRRNNYGQLGLGDTVDRGYVNLAGAVVPKLDLRPAELCTCCEAKSVRFGFGIERPCVVEADEPGVDSSVRVFTASRQFFTAPSDESSTDVHMLAEHRVDYGVDALHSFKYQRVPGNKFRFEVGCLQGVSSPSTELLTTPATDSSNGDLRSLDRQVVDCGSFPILEFRMETFFFMRSYVMYQYQCSSLPHTGTCRTLQTTFSEDGNGNPVHLDRHGIKCSRTNEAITKFQLVRDKTETSVPEIAYAYTCCAMPTQIVEL